VSVDKNHERLWTFSVFCRRLNSIRATEMGLSWTCHFVATISTCRRWFVSVHDFHGPCPWLSLKLSRGFGESQHNRISLLCSKITQCKWEAVELRQNCESALTKQSRLKDQVMQCQRQRQKQVWRLLTLVTSEVYCAFFGRADYVSGKGPSCK